MQREKMKALMTKAKKERDLEHEALLVAVDALEFYAKASVWDKTENDDPSWADIDGGDKAKEAIDKIKELILS